MSAGVVIVGAGLAGQRCCETLRAPGLRRPDPHRRRRSRTRPTTARRCPRRLLAGTTEAGDVALRPPGWHAEHGVELVLGARGAGARPRRARACRSPAAAARATTRLVVATGGAPRRSPDLRRRAPTSTCCARSTTPAPCAPPLRPGVRLAVVGAGLVGLEVAATARRSAPRSPSSRRRRRRSPRCSARRIGCVAGRAARGAAGVEVLTGVAVEAVHGRCARRARCGLGDGRRVACDAVLVAVGVAPATGWLAGCGLPAGRSPPTPRAAPLVPRVYAAGDVRGAGHWEAAARQGATVAATILGVPAPAAPPAAFWSDQHGVRLQFAGTAAGHDRAEVEGDPTRRRRVRPLPPRGRLVGGLLAGRPCDLARHARASGTDQPRIRTERSMTLVPIMDPYACSAPRRLRGCRAGDLRPGRHGRGHRIRARGPRQSPGVPRVASRSSTRRRAASSTRDAPAP